MVVGKLNVIAIKGRSFVDQSNLFGSQNLYLSFHLGSARKQKTTVHHACGSTPVWNQKLSFPIHEGRETVFVECWDKDFVGKTFVGASKILLSEVFAGISGRYEAWFPLKRPSGKIAGEVHLILVYEMEQDQFVESRPNENVLQRTQEQHQLHQFQQQQQMLYYQQQPQYENQYMDMQQLSAYYYPQNGMSVQPQVYAIPQNQQYVYYDHQQHFFDNQQQQYVPVYYTPQTTMASTAMYSNPQDQGFQYVQQQQQHQAPGLSIPPPPPPPPPPALPALVRPATLDRQPEFATPTPPLSCVSVLPDEEGENVEIEQEEVAPTETNVETVVAQEKEVVEQDQAHKCVEEVVQDVEKTEKQSEIPQEEVVEPIEIVETVVDEQVATPVEEQITIQPEIILPPPPAAPERPPEVATLLTAPSRSPSPTKERLLMTPIPPPRKLIPSKVVSQFKLPVAVELEENDLPPPLPPKDY